MWEQAFKRIISSEARGLGPSVARAALWAASGGYGAAMAARNLAFDVSLKSVEKVDVPVISIGNLTTGGTGKTPIVAAVVEMLQRAGHHPGIVSRGYRADSTGENDEKRVLEFKCPKVPHEQNPDRVAASKKLVKEQGVTSIVLDDAFQHRRIHRDANVVLIDATNPFGYGHLLPRGLLRESFRGLRRADFVLVTRSDHVSEERLQEICETCVQQNPRLNGRLAAVSFRPTKLLMKSGPTKNVEALSGKSVFAMTGIGNPDAFVATCERLGMTIVGTKFFPDHHHFSAEELSEVWEAAHQSGVDIVTTVKDFVKISKPPEDLYAIDIEAKFEHPDQQSSFETLLKSTES